MNKRATRPGTPRRRDPTLSLKRLPFAALRVDRTGVILDSNGVLERDLPIPTPPAGPTLAAWLDADAAGRLPEMLQFGSGSGEPLHLELGVDGVRLPVAFDVAPARRGFWLFARTTPPRPAEASDDIAQTKARFLATMSHELRTPLNAVLGYAGLLRDGVYGAVSDDQDRAVRAIIRRARDLQLLIDDVLALSRIEAGQVSLAMDRFDPGAVLGEIKESIAAFARGKGLRVTVSSSMRDPANLDREKYKQVVLQLAANAVKFTPAHGAVELTVTQDGTDRFRTRVRDTGIGIAPADVQRIFESFRQLDSGTTRRFAGSGLGLSIAHRIVTLLGGSIEVESAEGTGATFTVTLPLGASDPPVRLDAAGADSDDPVVVAIDDDPEVLTLLRDSLAPAHFRVAGARSGDRGKELARVLHPMAITLDIMMPDKDGWQVLRELKADPELLAIPVIVLSNLAERSLGTSLGAADYLVKPVERRTLIDALERLRATAPARRASAAF